MRTHRFYGRIFFFLGGLASGLFVATFSMRIGKPPDFIESFAQPLPPWEPPDVAQVLAYQGHMPRNLTALDIQLQKTQRENGTTPAGTRFPMVDPLPAVSPTKRNNLGQNLPSVLSNGSLAIPSKPESVVAVGERGDRAAICVRVKNEAPHIAEWIAFHLAVGVAKIIVLDDNSTDGLLKVISPYVSCGVVEYVPFIIEDGAGPGRPMSASLEKQMVPLKDCFQTLKKCPEAGIRWVALVDADEYLLPASVGDSLVTALSQHSRSRCVTVGRYQFGSNGHVQRPRETVIESYTKRAKLYQKYPKMILNLNPTNGSMMDRITNMHLPPKAGQNNIGPTACFGWPRQEEEFLRINHYLRSVEDFNTKVKSHFTGSSKYDASLDFFLERDSNEMNDMRAISYADQVQEILKLIDKHRKRAKKRRTLMRESSDTGKKQEEYTSCPIESWLRKRLVGAKRYSEKPVFCYPTQLR